MDLPQMVFPNLGIEKMNWNYIKRNRIHERNLPLCKIITSWPVKCNVHLKTTFPHTKIEIDPISLCFPSVIIARKQKVLTVA